MRFFAALVPAVLLANVILVDATSCKANGSAGTCISTSSCGSSGGQSYPGHCPGANDIQCCIRGSAPAPSGSFNADKVIAEARHWVSARIPYSWGGGHGSRPGPSLGTCAGYSGSVHPCPASHTVGFDCSGLVRDVIYAGSGINLGGGGDTNTQLADSHSHTISPNERQPGDIQFFGPRGATHHVILYTGKNAHGQEMMIEAEKTGTDVHEVPLRTGGIWVRVR
ncbi:hypothetical protein CPB97_000083 [Podila verticillata]|nr:hypothetical protein CPB97_000083 [Podila verticillata]